jgi:hypothetical protein
MRSKAEECAGERGRIKGKRGGGGGGKGRGRRMREGDNGVNEQKRLVATQPLPGTWGDDGREWNCCSYSE